MSATAIPAPVGGWNARDALDKMEATDAVRLVNWIPRGTFVQSRGGYSVSQTGLGGPVETLAAYAGQSNLLLAAADGKFWDVTVTPTTVATGFQSDRWQQTNHSGKLIFVNGVDSPQVFDGATMTAANFSGSPGDFVASTMWSVNSFKGRVFYWAENKQSFWYATAGAYQGVMAEFDLSTQITRGGYLVQMVTWTLDSGSGIDDLAVFIFSTGETLVYQGSDPGDVNDWSLIGRFQIGEPLGPRAHAKTAGTEIILTRDGYIDLSVALKDGRYSEKSAYSAKIIRASKDAPARYGSFFGWEAVLYPAGQMFIVNVPISSDSSIQHVRDTSQGGWCEFSGWNASTFCVFRNRLYFGDANGNVCLADAGTSDNGDRILSWGIPAFNALGSRANRKQLTAATVVSNILLPASYAYDGLADFNTTLRTTLVDDPNAAGSEWDVAEWDVAEWDTGAADDPTTRTGWKNCHAIGFSVTVSVRVNQRAQRINWYSTNIRYRNAGVN